MLGIGVRLGISLRALFLQCMWNGKTLQGPGFAWAMSAVRVRDKAALMAKHMGHFNATPALAPCLVAAAARMKEEGAGDSEIARFKESGAGPLSAVGDQLFWGVLRPLAALAGLVGTSLGPGVAVCLVLLVYNIPQGLLRVLSVNLGYGRAAEGVARCVEVARRVVTVASPGASAVLGFLAGGVLLGFMEHHSLGGGMIAVGATACMGWLMASCGASPVRICIALLALAGVSSLFAGS